MRAVDRALALDQRVGDERGAVDDLMDLLDWDPGLVGELADPTGDRTRGLVRGRQCLGDREAAGFAIEEQKVGEGSTDIDSDSRPIHCRLIAPVIG